MKDDSRGATKVYDEQSAIQIVTFDKDQWVSYDDWQSFEVKLDYANSHFLGGKYLLSTYSLLQMIRKRLIGICSSSTMVWAVSMDNDGTATSEYYFTSTFANA